LRKSTVSMPSRVIIKTVKRIRAELIGADRC